MKKKDSEASNELLKTGLVYSKSAAAGEVLLDAIHGGIGGFMRA